MTKSDIQLCFGAAGSLRDYSLLLVQVSPSRVARGPQMTDARPLGHDTPSSTDPWLHPAGRRAPLRLPTVKDQLCSPAPRAGAVHRASACFPALGAQAVHSARASSTLPLPGLGLCTGHRCLCSPAPRPRDLPPRPPLPRGEHGPGHPPAACGGPTRARAHPAEANGPRASRTQRKAGPRSPGGGSPGPRRSRLMAQVSRVPPGPSPSCDPRPNPPRPRRPPAAPALHSPLSSWWPPSWGRTTRRGGEGGCGARLSVPALTLSLRARSAA